MTKAHKIKNDESVELFPTFGSFDAAEERWTVRLHGWIHETEESSTWRRAAIASVADALGVEESEAGEEVFERRARYFLIDNERGKRVAVRVQDFETVLPESGSNGHFGGVLALSVHDAKRLGVHAESKAPRSVLCSTLPAKDGRVFHGRVAFVPRRGLSVISDIDDTVKVTEVGDWRRVVQNTFVEEYRAVEGMSELYEHWAREGASFHYVSSSPWQLSTELQGFLAANGYPLSSLHLKRFRAKDRSFLELLKSGVRTKPAQIQPILDALPERTFVMVGDSGENDPEVYGAFARELPEQVHHVYIRNVGGETRDSDRMRQAFAGVDDAVWTLFTEPGSVTPVEWQ